MPKLLNITGLRFGRLVVLEEHSKTKHRDTRWLCQCDCGNTITVLGGNLKSGQIRSCGCLRRDLLTKHGQSRTRTYRAWAKMLERCYNPNNPAYKRYGGRGIGVDDPNWFSYQKFFDEMGEQPPGCDLHRVNNDLGYSKANCVWLPHLEHMALHANAQKRGPLPPEQHVQSRL